MKDSTTNTIKLVRDILVIVFVSFMLTFFAYPLLTGVTCSGKTISITVGGVE